MLTLQYRQVFVSALPLVLCPWLRVEEYFCMCLRAAVAYTHHRRSLVSVIDMLACLSLCCVYCVMCGSRKDIVLWWLRGASFHHSHRKSVIYKITQNCSSRRSFRRDAAGGGDPAARRRKGHSELPGPGGYDHVHAAIIPSSHCVGVRLSDESNFGMYKNLDSGKKIIIIRAGSSLFHLAEVFSPCRPSLAPPPAA